MKSIEVRKKFIDFFQSKKHIFQKSSPIVIKDDPTLLFVNAGMNDRKKLRRVKIFIKKKTKDLVKDQRISGMISLMLIAGLPFYLGWKSQIPVFFGRYSYKAMGVISIYIVILIVFLYSFLSKRKQSN